MQQMQTETQLNQTEKRKASIEVIQNHTKTAPAQAEMRESAIKETENYTETVQAQEGIEALVETAQNQTEKEQRQDGEAVVKTARLTAVHRERYEVVTDAGTVYARLKSAVYHAEDIELTRVETQYPTVGDYVSLLWNPLGDSLITETLPRRTVFLRSDPAPNGGPQAVAANFDYVFVLTSLNLDFNLARLERYLILARESGALPVVLLTKADLVEQYEEEWAAAAALLQTETGEGLYAISAHTGFGLDALAPYLTEGKTVVLLGSSGVGKSSLVNALTEQERMKVSAIREDDSKGRHTTTHRQLISLTGGACLIDTPGMRTLGIWNASEGISATFADIHAIEARCRYADCTHGKEPGCAVRAAIQAGELSEKRYEGYQKICLEENYVKKKAEWQQHIREKRYSKQKGAVRKKKWDREE